MIVLKFGGTSMGSKESLQQVMDIIQQRLPQKMIVVVSAMSGVTDELLNSGKFAAAHDEQWREILKKSELRHQQTIGYMINTGDQPGISAIVKNIFSEIRDLCNGIALLEELSDKIKDKLAGYGELLSSQLLQMIFKSNQLTSVWKDSRDLIITDCNYGNARVEFSVTNKLIESYFKNNDGLTIMPGFIARDHNGASTTLGRGGSDFTASIIAAALNSESLEIWTDVSGMMTADPRWVPNARIIPNISYQEAMELSHFGAKVIYPPTIQPVMNKNIPVWIKNTFKSSDHGTVIENTADQSDHTMVRGISSINELALITLEGSGMVGIPGFSKRLFEALANEQINVILITQGSSEHSICVGIASTQSTKAQIAVDKAFEYEIQTGKVQALQVESTLSIIALVGDNMKNHTGISGKMFSALGRNGINIRAIAQGSSERNISAVIGTKDVRKAVNVLHEEFFETTYKQINLFITGVGNVGSKLMQQLHKQSAFLQNNLRLQINIAGISNSRKMVFNESIPSDNWQTVLDNGEVANVEEFVSRAISSNLRNSIFVDITANEHVAKTYAQLIEKNIAVVACNKIAASSSYKNYKQLKELTAEYNTPFLFETNVGAGLPIIGTLNDLLHSGDNVRRMEAVLSGTLNFVFNNYDGSQKFAHVVKQAQEEGYTEPDPRLDLSGMDVMRKIMILAREAGTEMEMNDIICNGFLPKSCFDGSVEDFYKEMEKHESHFLSLLEAAKKENCKLKFVASFNNGKASVGLQHISPSHDLFHLYGKDNVVLFYTDRYTDQPLVVKGAGAGAEVTASGVFADIIRAAKK